MLRASKNCISFCGLLLGISLLSTEFVFGQTGILIPARPEKPETVGPSRELAMQPLPEYRINAPDLLYLEMQKMVPLQPYRLELYDVLKICAAHALAEQPINDFYIVEGDGAIDLGPAYGNVTVVGMTVNEAVQAVARRLSEVLTDSGVSVQLSKTSSLQPVTGEYLVTPDGRINLRQYGSLSISGKTVAEARQAIESHLAKYLTDPKVSVEVRAFNSQYFYVILDGAGMGDNVRRLPITGNETVLDAVAAVNGISQLSSKKMWIARPTPGNPEKGTVLPVDYVAITQQGATATNYQLLPGDRLFIEGDPLIALNNELGKKTAPIERTLGLLGLETSAFNARRNYAPNVKPDKQEADLTEALQRYLKELTPLLEKK